MSDRFFGNLAGKIKSLGSKLGGEIQFRLEIRGMRKMAKQLEKLGRSVNKAMLNKAVTAGYRPIRDDVKRRAKEFRDTSTLFRSITTKKYKVKYKKGIAAGGVGAKYGLKMVTRKPKTARARSLESGRFVSVKVKAKDRKPTKPKKYNPGNYAHLVEFGTKWTKRRYPNGRFMTPAIKSQRRNAERIMASVLKQEIQKRINKIAANK